MSDERKETLADISAELRRMAEAQYEAWANDPNDAPDGRYWASFLCKLADRIDAAAVVQQSLPTEPVTKCHGLGDAAAMREALLRCDAIAQLPETRELQSIKDMHNIISAVLASPPRNCDVGTPEEQARRFESFCEGYTSEDEICIDCPLEAEWPELCAMRWVNRPYELPATQEGGKA